MQATCCSWPPLSAVAGAWPAWGWWSCCVNAWPAFCSSCSKPWLLLWSSHPLLPVLLFRPCGWCRCSCWQPSPTSVMPLAACLCTTTHAARGAVPCAVLLCLCAMAPLQACCPSCEQPLTVDLSASPGAAAAAVAAAAAGWRSAAAAAQLRHGCARCCPGRRRLQHGRCSQRHDASVPPAGRWMRRGGGAGQHRASRALGVDVTHSCRSRSPQQREQALGQQRAAVRAAAALSCRCRCRRRGRSGPPRLAGRQGRPACMWSGDVSAGLEWSRVSAACGASVQANLQSAVLLHSVAAAMDACMATDAEQRAPAA